MTVFEKARSLTFWLGDALKGNGVQKHFSDISFIMSSSNADQVESSLDSRLQAILSHSIITTGYYRGLDVTAGIDQFPVVDKNIIRNNEESFYSTQFEARDRLPVITSGSTGTPFKTYQNREKKWRNTADTIYFAKLAGYELGNKLYYFKIWSQLNSKSALTQFAQNIHPIDVLNLKANINDIINELNSNRSPVSFLGYSSAFEEMCKKLDGKNTLSKNLRINSIITMSEGLNPYTKSSGEKYFNCPVLSRYSNIENGILAQQTLAEQHEFTINKASYFIEIFDMEKDELVPDGSLGRVIVTDYFNKVMPMIRYDTGDLGIRGTRVIKGVEQKVLTRVEGRKLDVVYNTEGEVISSYLVYKNMWDYMEIEQYQFVQKGPKDYVLKVTIKEKFNREQQLTSEFKQYLGPDANFRIEYVDEIPLLQSGKRKKVKNEMLSGRSKDV